MTGMTTIVKETTRLISGLIFLYGVYIILHGHLTPGGGFAGGVIVAVSFILVILAFGEDIFELRESKEGSSRIESAAILLVVILALLGLVLGAHVFFANYLPKGVPGDLISAGIIPVYNIFIGIEVASALLSIFLAFVIFKEETSPTKHLGS